MRRGEIWYADLEPVRGSEANKLRPVVIVSNNGANRRAEELGRGLITVVPVTSSIARVYPFQIMLPAQVTGLPRDSKAQAEQIRAIDMVRLTRRAGRLDTDLVRQLDAALRLQLTL